MRHVFRLPEGVTLRKGYVTRGVRMLEVIGEGGTLMIAGIHKSGKPYVDLSPESDGAELPLRWVEFLQEELPPCNTASHSPTENQIDRPHKPGQKTVRLGGRKTPSLTGGTTAANEARWNQ